MSAPSRSPSVRAMVQRHPPHHCPLLPPPSPPSTSSSPPCRVRRHPRSFSRASSVLERGAATLCHTTSTHLVVGKRCHVRRRQLQCDWRLDSSPSNAHALSSIVMALAIGMMTTTPCSLSWSDDSPGTAVAGGTVLGHMTFTCLDGSTTAAASAQCITKTPPDTCNIIFKLTQNGRV